MDSVRLLISNKQKVTSLEIGLFDVQADSAVPGVTLTMSGIQLERVRSLVRGNLE